MTTPYSEAQDEVCHPGHDLCQSHNSRVGTFVNNKCFGDDTKAAARQSLNCIKNKTKIKIWRKTNMADGILTPCNVARSWHWFVRWLHPAMWHVALESWQWTHQVAAPAMWYVALGWPATEFTQTSAILEFYICFPLPHITAVDMSFCTSLQNFIQIWPPSAEKNDVMSIFKMADLSHLGL